MHRYELMWLDVFGNAIAFIRIRFRFKRIVILRWRQFDRHRLSAIVCLISNPDVMHDGNTHCQITTRLTGLPPVNLPCVKPYSATPVQPFVRPFAAHRLLQARCYDSASDHVLVLESKQGGVPTTPMHSMFASPSSRSSLPQLESRH